MALTAAGPRPISWPPIDPARYAATRRRWLTADAALDRVLSALLDRAQAAAEAVGRSAANRAALAEDEAVRALLAPSR